MIILPLLVVGTDKILKNEPPYVLIFSVLYAALCGYYHLYMMTILIGMYAIVRFFDLYKSDHLKNFFSVAGRGIFSYCLGIGLSAIIFFPGIAQFLSSGRSGYSNYFGSYNWSYYSTRLLRLIAPPGSKDDMAFAAIALFALALLLFAKRRDLLKKLTVLAFAIYMTSIGGFIMNGFQYSSNRWTFGLVLVVSFVVVEMLPELLNISGKQQMICIAVLCVYIFAALSTTTARKLAYVLVGIAFLALTSMVLMMQIKVTEPLELYEKQKLDINRLNRSIRVCV